MKEITGDIWAYHEKGHWIVITTNGNVKTNGEAVMGAGIALQAKQRYPEFPLVLGRWIRDFGNTLGLFQEYHIITFPTKHNWQERSDTELIDGQCQILSRAFGFASGRQRETIYLVRPGCSNGQLDWKDVKPILEKYLDDRFVVVERS